jgi:hypothetical protein
LEDHRTEPHGWPVVTDRYGSPRTETGDVAVSFTHGGSVTACIADGYEREETHLTAEEAREYAKALNEAADILDAFTSGSYVPPESTYVAPPPSPMMVAMQRKYLEGLKNMLEPRPGGSFYVEADKTPTWKTIDHYDFKGKP